ncbi:XrtA system polysaccharide deacetylase [Erythrobacter sp. YT30]|uniref:XrtA system polysaccharide deacetylase n=1 Tax=Erythrobacter sp. YT30 TaxID=1735012 RepID=UPI00076D31EB|nr:XrtA system polysaccharide deacetylase [Erythrobacter sp. YT30]KWV93076.1 polysaccharide deacetylase [Erythrobacter sp. YT30]
MHGTSSVDHSAGEGIEPIVNGMSVDVEDWFQVGAFENVISRDDWDSISCRVESNVDRILDLFDEAGIKSTFFTLGWMAERHPVMIRRIADRGHELASHGYDHARVFNLDRKRFSEDILKARQLIEDASGRRVTGYRAPSFSIDKRNPWAFEVLAEQGYAYSSSVAPIVHDHYGWSEAPRFAFNPVPGSQLVEVPVTTAMLGNRRVAAGGGGFFRVLPYAFSRWAIRQVNSVEARPAMFYFHPWEVDPDQPRVANAPLRSKLRHYTNLKAMAGKLSRLADEFRWGRCDDVARREALRAQPFDVTAPMKELAA